MILKKLSQKIKNEMLFEHYVGLHQVAPQMLAVLSIRYIIIVKHSENLQMQLQG